MDVRCEKCGAEYDFDASRIPIDGLQVQCSSCSQQFRVFSPGGADQPWKLRQLNGGTLQFRELNTLQRWIVERKVSAGDEISKTGRSWKRLGEIAELASFFHVVDQASEGSDVEAWEVGEQVSLDDGFGLYGVPQARGGDERKTGVRTPSALHSQREGASGLPWGLVGSVVVVGVLALVASLWLGGGPSKSARIELQAAYRQLLGDSDQNLESAMIGFRQAIEFDAEYSDAYAYLAMAELVRADRVSQEAADLESVLEGLPAVDRQAGRERIENLRARSGLRIEKGFLAASTALKLDPRSVRANQALALYYVHRGTPADARAHLSRMRDADPDDVGVAYVDSLLMMSDEVVDDAMVVEALKKVLLKEPDMNRARVQLGKRFLVMGNLAEARRELEGALQRSPDHGGVTQLLVELSHLEQRELAALQAEAAKNPVVRRRLATRTSPAPIVDGIPAAMPRRSLLSVTGTPEEKFDKLLGRADRLRDRNRPKQALILYLRALDHSVNDPDALTGVGWCYHELTQYDVAIDTFLRVLKRSPRFSDAHMGLAESYRMKGDEGEAAKYYRSYLDILPDGPDADLAKERLEQL